MDLLSKPGEPLRCRLRHVQLSNTKFTALSYVWGDSAQQFWIEVVGTRVSRLPLTQNLHCALQDLRDCPDTQTKTFWIDQICINQNDNVEKGQQVGRMSQIYQSAVDVLTYLGPEAPGDEEALDLALAIYQQFRGTFWVWGRTRSVILANLDIFVDKYKDRASIPAELVFPRDLRNDRAYRHLDENIISTHWLTRLWLVQENVINDRGGFLKGPRFVPWLCFGLIAELSQSCLLPTIRSETSLWVLYLARAIKAAPKEQRKGVEDAPAELYELIRMFGNTECREKVDKIYGVLGLAEDVEKLDIVPDYTSPPAQVFTDLAVLHIRESQRQKNSNWLRVLERVGRDGPRDSSYPSWVPDFESSPYPVRDDIPNASRFSRRGLPDSLTGMVTFASTASLKSSILVVKGVRVAVLNQSLGYMTSSLKYTMTVESWANLKAIFDSAIGYLGGNDRAFAILCQTIMLDQHWPRSSSEPTKAAAHAFQEIYQTLQRAIDGASGQEEKSRQNFSLTDSMPKHSVTAEELIADSLIKDMYLCLTYNGNLVLAPKRAVYGDIVVALAGGSFLYVLRPCEGGFKYIGWAFLHGAMEGEVSDQDKWQDGIETFRIS